MSKGKLLKSENIVMERPKPTLYLSEKDLKAIKNWQVGKKYNLCIEVKMTGMHESDSEYSDRGFSGDFKITKIKEDGRK